MGQTEVMMMVVLVCLALLLGVLFGGSAVWYLKPDSETRVVENVVSRFVCSDGTTKELQSECPYVKTTSGKTEVVCPPCDCTDTTGNVYRKCDCVTCAVQCGVAGIVTTTTIPQPICDPCSKDSDCGQPSYSDVKCNKDKMYKLYNEPFCSDGCCKTKQTRSEIRSCMSNEACEPTGGCIPYDNSGEDD